MATGSTLAAVGTFLAILAAVVLWWSSHTSGREAKRERGEIRAEVGRVRTDMTKEIGRVRTDMQGGFSAVRSDMDAGFTEIKELLRRDGATESADPLAGGAADSDPEPVVEVPTAAGILREPALSLMAKGEDDP